MDDRNALDALLDGCDNAVQMLPKGGEGRTFDTEDIGNAREALASLRLALAAREGERDDARLMLRRLVPCVAIRGGARAPKGKWIVTAMNGRDYRCDDDGTGLPILTDQARAALRGAGESP